MKSCKVVIEKLQLNSIGFTKTGKPGSPFVPLPFFPLPFRPLSCLPPPHQLYIQQPWRQTVGYGISGVGEIFNKQVGDRIGAVDQVKDFK